MTEKFPGKPQSLRVRLLPLGGAVARSAAEGVIQVRTPGTDSFRHRCVMSPSSRREALAVHQSFRANRKACGFARASPFGRGVTAGDGEG